MPGCSLLFAAQALHLQPPQNQQAAATAVALQLPASLAQRLCLLQALSQQQQQNGVIAQ
jgi:hypothetical protein